MSAEVDAWGSHFLMAHPAKALCDLLYVRKVHWKGIVEAASNLRIEEEDYQSVSEGVIASLEVAYANYRVRAFLAGWRKECSG